MKISVLDGYCLNPGDLSWDGLSALGDLQIYDRTPAAEIEQRAAGADAILTNKTPLTAGTIAALPSLRYVGVLATGYNHIDLHAAEERGIVVTNIPTYGTHSVAQFTMALLLELCHRAGMHADAVRAGEWTSNRDWCFWKSPQIELAGKQFGVVGFGRIGRQAATAAAALGMKIAAYDAQRGSPLDGCDFQWMDLDELLATSDVVSLHCPLFPATEGLINQERLRTMKRSAFLLNTSRGRLVVAADLAEALNAGRIAGAAMDVVPEEPPQNGSPLFGARNCIVTPHMAWATREARQRLLAAAIENLRAFVSGRPVNVVG